MERRHLWRGCLRETLFQLEGAAFDPVVRKLSIPHLPDGDAGELDRPIVGRHAEDPAIESGRFPTRDHARAVRTTEQIEAYESAVANQAEQRSDPFGEGLPSDDILSCSGENKILRTEPINRAEVVRRVVNLGPKFGEERLPDGLRTLGGGLYSHELDLP